MYFPMTTGTYFLSTLIFISVLELFLAFPNNDGQVQVVENCYKSWKKSLIVMECQKVKRHGSWESGKPGKSYSIKISKSSR